MLMYFGGSEVKLWRDLLAEQKVPNVSLSYIGLLRRNKNSPGTSEWLISEHYPDFQRIFLDSGAFTLNKEGSEYTQQQAHDLAIQYYAFILKNIDRVSLVSEFDAQILGQKYIEDARKSFYAELPQDKFMPIWHQEYGIEELERLCSQYDIVGIPTVSLGDKSLVPMLNNFVSRYKVRLHGVAITGRKLLREVRWDSVASTSWISPSRFGDTIIWVGNELKRYPRAYKDNARNKHGAYLEHNGFDLDKIQADDSHEILRLSLWSWLKYSENLERVTKRAGNESSNFAETGISGVDNLPSDRRNDNLVSTALAIPETSAFELALRGQTTEAKTTEQRKVLLSALIDMQGQRVLTLKKNEDAEGLADINLSVEADRLARYIKQQSEMEKQSFSLKIEASAPAGEGFMSSIFGSAAGEKLRPEQQTSAEVVEDIHEAEVIE